MTQSLFRFRLRVASRQDGKFAFSTSKVETNLSDEVTIAIVARNADSLDKATSYHIDAGGFSSEQEAREIAEALRVRLRLLNALLGLGLNIPIENTISGQVSSAIKTKLQEEQGATVIDSIWGINVYPDDGLHFECVLGGNVVVRPSEPSYLFEGLKTLWNLDISLDASSEFALHILCLATQEASEKATFLTGYLALEQLIERRPRSELARAQIRRFQEELASATDSSAEALSGAELQSLNGALSALNEESFSSALMRFARTIATPELIKGHTPQKFLSACIAARNKIAHQAEPSTEIPLTELSAGLREIVLALIWTRNNLTQFSISTPPSAISIPEGGMQIRMM